MRVTDIPELLMTDRTAAAFGLAIGDTIDVAADAGMTAAHRFRISGIYRPKADPFEIGYGRLHVKMHLPDLNRVLDHDDQVDRFIVRLRDPADRVAATADLNGTLVGLRAYTSEDLAARASSTFVVVSQFHKAIGVVSLLAGLVFLIAIMVLKVEAMRRELGVLRLLGISRRTVVRSVLAISTLVALLGSLVGIGLGFAAAALVNPLAQHRYDTDLVFVRVTPSVIGLAVGLSILLGIAAGVAVAARSARAHPLRQIGR